MAAPNNHAFGVEFDVFQNQEFNDINDNHVGIDVNSLTCAVAYKAGYRIGKTKFWSFKEIRLNDGANYRVWIDYSNPNLSITLAPDNKKKKKKKKPQRALIDVSAMFFLMKCMLVSLHQLVNLFKTTRS